MPGMGYEMGVTELSHEHASPRESNVLFLDSDDSEEEDDADDDDGEFSTQGGCEFSSLC